MENKNNLIIKNIKSFKNFVSIKTGTTWFQVLVSFGLGYILTLLFVKSFYIFLNWEVVLIIYIGTIIIGGILSFSLTHIINILKYFMDLD